MSKKVTVDNFALEIANLLQEYGEDIEDDVKECTNNVIKEAKREIIANSPKSKKDVYLKGGKIHKAGSYARGWAIKTSSKIEHKYYKVIWNKTDYRLTHLLEFGHANSDGTRTEAISHIRPVENKYREKFTNEFINRVKRGK